ncbi:MAG TPA: ribosome maturation factor RimM [Bryobacteraceae bacterium]|nr:ribosome maturation factor RimM [Bryobacteraceae bacterium]
MSPQDENQWVTIARLGRAWGNRGALAAISLTSRPERFQQLGEVFLFREGKPVGVGGFQVESVREHARAWVFKFRGVDTISDAEPLEHAEVRLPLAERLPVEEGEHYVSDLIGCEVMERNTGRLVGIVTGWQEAGGAGLLEIGEGDDRLMVPFARSICVEVDTGAKRILVVLPEGLKDLNCP